MKLLEQLKNIRNLLIEVKIKDLRKQNPDLVDFIDILTRWPFEVPNKYLQWVVIRRKKEKWGQLSDLDIAEKIVKPLTIFDNLLDDGGLDKAVKFGIIDRKQTDISYWNKKIFKEFEEFVDKLVNYNIDLKALRKQKFNEKYTSDKVYENERIIAYCPTNHVESCEIGKGRWCIGSDDRTEWFKYSLDGKVFVYLIDKFVNPKNDSKAFCVLEFLDDELKLVWNYKNKKIKESELEEHYGEDLWEEILDRIDTYLSSRNIYELSDEQDIFGLNFSEMNLVDQNLSGMDLHDCKFDNSDLRGSDFSDADLTMTSFDRARLEDAKLTNTKLEGANFNYADLRKTDFYNADLSGADLDYANLNDSNFRDADLEGTKLNAVEAKDVNFDGANFRDAEIVESSLDNSSFVNASFEETNLIGSTLTGADLSNVNMSGADLMNVDLSDANLDGVDLSVAKNIDKKFLG